jgi:hypothetical protein
MGVCFGFRQWAAPVVKNSCPLQVFKVFSEKQAELVWLEI